MRKNRSHPLLWLLALVLGLGVPFADAHAGDSHKVRSGDTLGEIGERYGCTVDALKRANRLESDVIRVGQTLKLPDSCKRVLPEATNRRGKTKRLVHKVVRGETLEEIALRYGMPLAELEKKNQRVLRKGLKPGLRLRIETTEERRAQHKIAYTIEAGDTLSSIARRFGISVRDLKRMNPRKDPRRLQIGDQLVIVGKPGKSQAVGLPQRGRLVDGEQFKDVRGAFILRPAYAWGTNETIRALEAAIAEVRRKHKKLHDIVVGDISRKEGGYLRPHKSHQSGLDVDIGLYFKEQPKQGPRTFIDGMRKSLDLAATWDLVQALAGKGPKSSSIEYMFISYPLQKRLYEYASEKKGVSASKLRWLFQYPRGSRAMRGLIRHEPGHTNHIHIRYKCPKGDEACL